MKSKSIGIGGIVSVGLIGMIMGCGGSSTPADTSVPSTFTEESAKVFATNLTNFEGCSAVDVGSLPLLSLNSISVESSSTVETRAYDIYESISGVCGGTVDISGEHDDGTTTLAYTYSDFCLAFAAKEAQLTGVANVVNLGNPSDLGPVVYEDTISTDGRIAASVTDVEDIARALPSTLSVALTNFSQKYGSGDKDVLATALKPDTINVDAADVIYDSSGKKYAVSGVKASTYIVSNILNVLNANTTYTDPELGTYVATADGLELPLNSLGIPVGVNGSVKITATDGTKGEMTLDNGVIVLFMDDGTPVAQVDCTALANQIID